MLIFNFKFLHAIGVSSVNATPNRCQWYEQIHVSIFNPLTSVGENSMWHVCEVEKTFMTVEVTCKHIGIVNNHCILISIWY